MLVLLSLLATGVCLRLPAQSLAPRAKADILEVLDHQEAAWNEGSLEGFMQGYWKSDSLMFIGKSGVTRGWQSTLDNYKRGYPDRAAMGTLTFTLVSMQSAGSKSALVVGKWHLARTEGDLQGHFSLLWKKIKGEWVIVADHSS